jgi:peptidase E
VQFALDKVLFVPYALHDREGYANKAEEAFKSFGKYSNEPVFVKNKKCFTSYVDDKDVSALIHIKERNYVQQI